MTSAPRLAWADTGRALAVIAVVLFHALIWNFGALESAKEGMWAPISTLLSVVRVPLLLALSGFFMANSLLGSWRSRKIWVRALRNYYLYAVWLVVYGVFYALLSVPGFPHRVWGVPHVLQQLLVPQTTLWYIFALALFPVVVVLLRAVRVPPVGIFIVALSAWAFGTFAQLPLTPGKLFRTFIFFVVGVYAARVLRWIAGAHWAVTAMLAVALALVLWMSSAVDELVVQRFSVLVASVIAIGVGVGLTALLCRWERVAVVGAWLGARTLSVYVLHVPLLAVAYLYLGGSSLHAFVSTAAGAAIFPLALTIVVVGLSLLIGELLDKIPGRPLTSFPLERALVKTGLPASRRQHPAPELG